MEWIVNHLDILINAPLAVLLLVFIYLHNNKIVKIIEGYQKMIEKLIDKLK